MEVLLEKTTFVLHSKMIMDYWWHKSLTDASPCSHQDNVFIMSNPKSKFPVLQLDLRLAYSSFPHPGYYGTLKLCNRKKNLLGC